MWPVVKGSVLISHFGRKSCRDIYEKIREAVLHRMPTAHVAISDSLGISRTAFHQIGFVNIESFSSATINVAQEGDDLKVSYALGTGKYIVEAIGFSMMCFLAYLKGLSGNLLVICGVIGLIAFGIRLIVSTAQVGKWLRQVIERSR